MAMASKRVHATIASHLEIWSQELAETTSILQRLGDALDALSVEGKLAGLHNDEALRQACEQAFKDLDRLDP